MNRITVKLYLLGTATRDRVARASREQGRDAGIELVEVAILISVIAVLALAVAGLIKVYVTNKMSALG